MGWIVRNGKLAADDGSLKVETAKGRAFLARSGLSLKGPLVGKVRRKGKGGNLGFAWRVEGQKDFPKDQVRTVTVEASDAWQDVTVPVPADGKVIRVRLLLPGKANRIRHIEFLDAETRNSRARWRFDQ